MEKEKETFRKLLLDGLGNGIHPIGDRGTNCGKRYKSKTN